LNRHPLAIDTLFVVDPQFKTKADGVMIGGTAAKYSRRYNMLNDLSNFDSQEIGEQMAEECITAWMVESELKRPSTTTIGGDTSISEDEITVDEPRLPKFFKPLVQQATMPGDLEYFSAVLTTIEKYADAEGTDIVFQEDMTFSKIKLDRWGCLTEMQHLGPDKVPKELANLLGLHESYFGLLAANENDELFDPIEHLQQKQFKAMVLEQFKEFLARMELQETHKPDSKALEIHELMKSQKEESAKSWREQQKKVMNLTKTLHLDMETSSHMIRSTFKTFLDENRVLLQGIYDFNKGMIS